MAEKTYRRRFFRAGRMCQVDLTCGADIAALATLDRQFWTVLSADVRGLRFDARTLALLDATGTGRIDQADVLAAIRFLQERKVDLETLFHPDPADERRLAEVTAQQADLDAAAPSDADRAAHAAWENAPKADPAILPLGAATAEAEAALAALEPAVEAWFTVPEETPLVTEEPDRDLPLADHLNPKYADLVAAFAEKTVAPLYPDAPKTRLTRREWRAVQAKFAPYRAWQAAKPVAAADAKAKLETEERVLRYKLHLLEFLENFVNQRRLYRLGADAMYQTGTLYMDGRAFVLCFSVADEAAHAALAEKSRCCLVYAKCVRKGTAQTRTVCAVVTAGRVAPLYAGRNGLFIDRDGVAWDATATKVVSAQVSLFEAFWAPWTKLAAGVSDLVKKFMADKQTANAPKPEKMNAATLASATAALSVGFGMLSAACAGAIGVIAGLPPYRIVLGIVALVVLISGPSAVLAYLRLRQRDLGAILNAGGWAVNRPLRFSLRLARTFTQKGHA